MARKLILTWGGEEQVHEVADVEAAFAAAVPWVMQEYIARITDQHGVVTYTQALAGGQVATYLGDATAGGADPEPAGQSPAPAPNKPWWRFW